MLIKFSQPNDFKYHGRDVLIESSEIYSVQQVDDGTELRMRSGDHWIVKQSPREVRKLMAETNRLWACNPMSDPCGGCVECLLKQSQHYLTEQEKAMGELHRLVELYVTTPNTDPIVAEHFDKLCGWYANHKRPDGSEPLPVATTPGWQEL